jgi:hypothetical protein
MPNAVTIKLTKEEIQQIQEAAQFTPQFPVNFLFNFTGSQPYHTGLTATNNQQYQMAAWIQAPPKQQVCWKSSLESSILMCCAAL